MEEWRRNVRRGLSLLALVVLLVGHFPGCKSPPAKEIRIGLITPLSGDVKTFGESVKNAFEVAVEEANAKGAGADGRRKEYMFRACYPDSFQGTVMAKFARGTLNATAAAVLYDASNDYSKGIAEVFRDAFVRMGGRVTAFESDGN